MEKNPAPVLQKPQVSFLVDAKIILLGSVAISYRNIGVEISAISIGTGESHLQVEALQCSAPIKQAVTHGSQLGSSDRPSCSVLLGASVQHPRTYLPGWVQIV